MAMRSGRFDDGLEADLRTPQLRRCGSGISRQGLR